MPMLQPVLQRRWFFLAVFFLAFGVAKAATSYTDMTVFESSSVMSPGFYQETYTGHTAGNQFVTSRAYGTTFAYTLATSGGGTGDNLWVVSAGANLPSGKAMSSLNSDTDLLITFTSGNVTAAGANFFLTTDNPTDSRVAGTVQVTFTFSDTSTSTMNVTSSASGPAGFLGFTVPSGTITSIRARTLSGSYVTLDNVDAGVTPVPEIPSSGIAAALFCLLIGGRAVIKGVRSKL